MPTVQATGNKVTDRAERVARNLVKVEQENLAGWEVLFLGEQICCGGCRGCEQYAGKFVKKLAAALRKAGVKGK